MVTIPKNETPAMFSRIARRYDLLNHLLSLNVDRAWRRELVRRSGLSVGGGIVLDACTGTGDVAITFAQRSSAADIFGIDMSADMLLVGRAKLERAGLGERIQLVQGDVLDLPFEAGVFDAVTIAFGLRNLPDFGAGVAEMARVLKKGGRLLILEFSPPKSGAVLRAYRLYLEKIVPVVGGAISGSRQAYRYLADSIAAFPTDEEIHGMMQAAGLGDIRSKRLTGGIASIHQGER